MDAPLPCPFCGSTLSESGYFWLHPEAETCPIGEFEFAPDDIKHWNTSTPSGLSLPESDSADHLGVVIGRKDTTR